MIYSQLNYCITTWGNACPTTLEPLFKLQKRAVRIISFSKNRESSSPLFRKLEILKLKDILFLQTAIFMHKISNVNLPPSQIQCYVPASSVHRYETRYSQQNNYFLTHSNTLSGRKCLRMTGPVVWSQIPNDLKSLSLGAFKKRIKTYLISNY